MVLCTANEIAQQVRLSPFTIRRLGYAGKIKEYRCGAAVRYDPAEVLRLMAHQGTANLPATEQVHR